MESQGTTDVSDFLKRVARVAPAIREAAEEIERSQRLSPDLRAKLHDEIGRAHV